MDHTRNPKGMLTNPKQRYHVHQLICKCPYPHGNPFEEPLYWNVGPTIPHMTSLSTRTPTQEYHNASKNLTNDPSQYKKNHDKAATSTDSTASSTSEGLHTTEDRDDLEFMQTDTHSDHFLKFLESGCVIAEKIAIRNQHRPCFKNVHHLCECTKIELAKPSNIIQHIHSQGVPAVIKDFISAYVSLSNCWNLVTGYLKLKESTMRHIAHELNADFRTCCVHWASHTKQLSEHMVRIFSSLDNNLRNPNANHSQSNCKEIRMSPNTQLASTSCSKRKWVNKPNLPINMMKTCRAEGHSVAKLQHIKKVMEMSFQNMDRDESSNAFNACNNLPREMKPNTCDENHIWRSLVEQENQQDSEDSFDSHLDGEPFNEQTTISSLSLEQKIVGPPHKQPKYEEILGQNHMSDSYLRKILENEQYDRVIHDRLDMPYDDTDTENIKVLLDTLEKTEFNQTITDDSAYIAAHADNLQIIIRKYASKCYTDAEAVFYDLHNTIITARKLYRNNPKVLRQLREFCSITDECMQRTFRDIRAEERTEKDHFVPNR